MGEPLDGHQQESLACDAGMRLARLLGSALFPGIGGMWAAGTRTADAGEQRREELVEGDAVAGCLGEQRDIGDQRFERRGDIGVARGLRAGRQRGKTAADTAGAVRSAWTMSCSILPSDALGFVSTSSGLTIAVLKKFLPVRNFFEFDGH
jgi:hypothetical protein